MDRDTDIFDLVTDDHEEVEALFDDLDGVDEGSPSAAESFARLSEALDLHTRTEEAVLYPALRDKEETRRFLGDALDDHSRVRECVTEIGALPVGSDDWRRRLSQLRELVEDHIALEEDEIFERMRGAFDDKALRDLARRFARVKDAQAKRESSAA